ncbi:MAG: response regulator transcription factor [bacterium]
MKILIAEDQTLFREALCKLLEFEEDIEVVGEAKNGVEAVSKVKDSVPDIVLMDIDMPKLDGVTATRMIKKESPHTKIIILTVHKEEEHLFSAIKAGAIGYVVKENGSKNLLSSIRAVFRGETLLSPSIAIKLLKEFKRLTEEGVSKDIFNSLTKREQEVLKQLSAGKSNKEIANALYISEATVKTHITNILEKLHVNDRTQAAIYALKRGFD